jgi:hypothetical protein
MPPGRVDKPQHRGFPRRGEMGAIRPEANAKFWPVELSGSLWRETMIREGCFHRGPGVADLQIAQRTNAPAVARPLDGLRLGVHRLGCSSGPARPLRPQPSDKLEF